MEKEKYFIYNIESGENDEVTKEQYEKYQQFKQMFKNLISPTLPNVGKIMITGTMAEENHTHDFEIFKPKKD